MKRPRIRIRTLMLGIAALSCVFTVEAARRRRSFCLARAEFHRHVNEGRWEFVVPDPSRGQPLKWSWAISDAVKNVIIFNDDRYHWHEQMQKEFSRVASRPWQRLPDDSHPPPEESCRISTSRNVRPFVGPRDSADVAYCNVHLVPMNDTSVATRFFAEALEDAKAREKLFPNSDDSRGEGCFPSGSDYFNAPVCVMCNKARDSWFKLRMDAGE